MKPGRAGLLLRIARAEVRAGRSALAGQAIEAARTALRGAPASAEHYGVNVFRAWLAATDQDAPAALAALAEAEPYRALGDVQSVARAHEAAAIAYGIERDLARWRAGYEGMIAALEAGGDTLRSIGAMAGFANSALGLGQTELALALSERAVATAREQRRLELVPYVLAAVAWIWLTVGELARARELVELALPHCGDFPASELIAAAVGVVVAIRSEDDALLERCFRPDLFEQALRGGAPWQFLAVVPALTERHAALREPDRAHAVVARMAGRSPAAPIVPELVVKIAEYGLERDYPAAGQGLAAEAAARPHVAGFLHLYRALAARGGSERERHARLAADAFRAVGYRLWEAWARERAGDAEGARALYAVCGATRDVRRLSAGRPGTPSQPAVQRLTKREAQIAELAVVGLSNREIAERLTLQRPHRRAPPRGVFAKLGVRSRVELAARRARDPRT